MYAREASLCLKAEPVSQFLQKVEHEVIPLFRKQRVFSTTSSSTQIAEILFMSILWENREDAEKYDRTTLPMLNKLLAGVVDGALSVHAFGGSRARLSGV
jgi:hypothetical protein